MVNPPSTLEVVRPADLPSLAKQINSTHASAKRHAQLGVVFAIRTGLLCIEAKAICEHGSYEKWADENLSIGTTTRTKYVALVKSSLGELLGSGAKLEPGSNLPLLLTSSDFLPKIEKDAAYRDEITSSLQKVVGEGSLTDLYRELSIIRAPGNVDEETGKRKHFPAKKDKRTADEIAEENRAAANARILAAIGALKVATEDKQARRWLKAKDWVKIARLVADRSAAVTKISGHASVAEREGEKMIAAQKCDHCGGDGSLSWMDDDGERTWTSGGACHVCGGTGETFRSITTRDNSSITTTPTKEEKESRQGPRAGVNQPSTISSP